MRLYYKHLKTAIKKRNELNKNRKENEKEWAIPWYKGAVGRRSYYLVVNEFIPARPIDPAAARRVTSLGCHWDAVAGAPV